MTDNSTGSVPPFLSLDDRSLVDQCQVDLYRSHGPGGQKRNKTSSAVRLRHGPTGLIVVAVEDRSQHVNKARAIRRLREAIALHVRGTIDLDRYTRSERLAGCIPPAGDIRLGRRDERYFFVVSEVLDVLAARGVRVSETAKQLGISTSHLMKFFRNNPKLWARVNQMRTAVGANTLR